MASVAGLGNIFGNLFSVSPDTLRLMAEEERAKAAEAYKQSLLGMTSKRLALEQEKLRQPQYWGPGTFKEGAPGQPAIQVTPWAPKQPSTADLRSEQKNLAEKQAADIAMGPWSYEEKFRRIGALGLNPHNFLIAPEKPEKPEKPAKPTFLESQILAGLRKKHPGKEVTEEEFLAALKKQQTKPPAGKPSGWRPKLTPEESAAEQELEADQVDPRWLKMTPEQHSMYLQRFLNKHPKVRISTADRDPLTGMPRTYKVIPSGTWVGPPPGEED